MELRDAIQQRRSVRRFLDKPVEAATLRRLLDLAAMAPSATNRRAWHFIVIDDLKLREEMVRRGGSRTICRAPCGILVVYGTASLNVNYQDDVQSAAAAVQNLLLAATDSGLGACWTCHLPPPRELCAMLGIPRGYRPVAYVALGHPVPHVPAERPDRSAKAMTSWNGCSLEPVSVSSRMRYWILRLLVRSYYLVPAPLRARLGPFVNRTFVTKFD